MFKTVGSGLGKGVFLALNILGNGMFVEMTYEYPLELIQHYKEILLGTFEVTPFPDSLYIAFIVWGIVFTIICPGGFPSHEFSGGDGGDL